MQLVEHVFVTLDHSFVEDEYDHVQEPAQGAAVASSEADSVSPKSSITIAHFVPVPDSLHTIGTPPAEHEVSFAVDPTIGFARV